MSVLNVNTINERTSASGVTIDGVLIKDNKLASGTGNVLQVVTGTLTGVASTTSSTYADTGLTASITCSATSSKVLVLVTHNTAASASSIPALYMKLLRDSTSLGEAILVQNGGSSLYGTTSFTKLDSPSSTSALTYKTQFREASNGTAYVSADSFQDNIVLMEIGG